VAYCCCCCNLLLLLLRLDLLLLLLKTAVVEKENREGGEPGRREQLREDMLSFFHLEREEREDKGGTQAWEESQSSISFHSIP